MTELLRRVLKYTLNLYSDSICEDKGEVIYAGGQEVNISRLCHAASRDDLQELDHQ